MFPKMEGLVEIGKDMAQMELRHLAPEQEIWCRERTPVSWQPQSIHPSLLMEPFITAVPDSTMTGDSTNGKFWPIPPSSLAGLVDHPSHFVPRPDFLGRYTETGDHAKCTTPGSVLHH